MKHAVGFEQPARLRIHQVQDGPAGLRRAPVAQCVRSQVVERAGAVRIEQRIEIGYLHRRLDRRHPQGHAILERRLGADFQKTGERREAGALHLHTIEAEGQRTDRVMAFRISGEGAPHLRRLPDQTAGGCKPQAAWILHRQAQLTHASLRGQRQSDRRKQPKRFPVQRWMDLS